MPLYSKQTLLVYCLVAKELVSRREYHSVVLSVGYSVFILIQIYCDHNICLIIKMNVKSSSILFSIIPLAGVFMFCAMCMYGVRMVTCTLLDRICSHSCSFFFLHHRLNRSACLIVCFRMNIALVIIIVPVNGL